MATNTNEDPNALLNRFKVASPNPAAILQVALDRVTSALDGEVEFVDPSNPAISLLETSAVIGSNSVNQGVALIRRLYPIQAQTPEDLYAHMSYRDYINRFATPSIDPFIFFVSLSQFMNFAVRPEGANYVMITIPRNTEISVNEYVSFTLQYPIDIKYFDTQSLEISFDSSTVSPLQSLTTNIINYTLMTEPSSNERWIRFEIDVPQVDIKKVTTNTQRGRYMVMDIDFSDQYVMTRAYYRNSNTSNWVEMKTTHSPDVIDPTAPTVQLKVINNTLTASLPIVYQTTGQVNGEVRFDVYTSKGAEIINLSDYPAERYKVDMTPLDPAIDSSVYVAAAVNVNVRTYSTAIMSGGKNALTFQQLKDRVINSSLGQQEIPITNVNATAFAENQGFELIPNVDVVTNRIFLASRSLPKPSDSRLVTPANIGISTFITDDPVTVNHPWVRVHNDRVTFLSRNLYQMKNGQLQLLPVSAVDSLLRMEPSQKLSAVNSGNYMYSPFYYVLNTASEELQTRAYHLDQPKASDLSFVAQNPTIQLVVNTGTYSITKTYEGYNIQIQTKSGSLYKQLQDNEVYAQLAVVLPNATRRAYWKGELIGRTEDGERIFQFNLKTDYDIDTDNLIQFINARINNDLDSQALVNLTARFDIFHITTSLTQLYRPSKIDQIIAKFLVPGLCGGITHETVKFEFGKALDGLWTRSRTLPDTEIFERYAIDVPLVYETDVYGSPPFTVEPDGSLKYNVLFKAGEVQRDENGDIIYLHRKGDVVRVNGEPVSQGVLSAQREFDILLVDGKNYFVTDQAYLAYNKEFVSTIVDWTTQDIPELNKKALDNTKIFFYPKNRLSRAKILIADYTEMSISAEQPLTIDLYVPDSVDRDDAQKASLRNKIISYLDQWISQQQLAVSEAQTAITDLFPDSIEAIKIDGLGPNQDMSYVLIAADKDRLSLKRILDVQQDGLFIIREDVTINFYKASPAKPEL
jgi:hypothetical protein